MSDNIPYDIQVDIIKYLPVKSLIQFRSVSKTWKSLIDSSDFIAHYKSQQDHLFVYYFDKHSSACGYVLIVDDDTFPQRIISLNPPRFVINLGSPIIIGSSHGLVCLYGGKRGGDGSSPKTGIALIWNISIRKVVGVVVPNVGQKGMKYKTLLGFGVCRETSDPKIVKISYIFSLDNIESISCIPWQVEVFSLSTGAWRSPYSNLPDKSIYFDSDSVYIDGFLYWLVTDYSDPSGEFGYDNLIISFDMTSEEFTEVNLPYSLARHRSDENLYISKLKKSLVVLEREVEKQSFIVWIVEDGVSKSLTKLFTINPPDASVSSVLEFRQNGEPIIKVQHLSPPYGYASSIEVYEPNSKHINTLEINGYSSSDHMVSHMETLETLLMLDQPNYIIYGEDKHNILKERTKNKQGAKSKRLL